MAEENGPINENIENLNEGIKGLDENIETFNKNSTRRFNKNIKDLGENIEVLNEDSIEKLNKNTKILNKNIKGLDENVKNIKESDKSMKGLDENVETSNEDIKNPNKDFRELGLLGNLAEDMSNSIKEKLSTIKGTDEKVYETLTKSVEGITGKFNNIVDGLSSKIGKIPIFGKMLEDILDIDSIKKSFGEGLLKGVTEGAGEGVTKSILGGKGNITEKINKMSDKNKMSGKILSKLTEPTKIMKAAAAGMVVFAAFVMEAFKLFVKLDKAAEDFRKTTGFTTDQMEHIKGWAHDIAVEYSYMGIGAEEAYKATEALTKEFSNIQSISKDSVVAVSMLATNFGIAEDSAAGFLGMMRSLGVESQKMAINLSVATIQLAEAAGVAPKQIFEDIASASSDTMAFISGSKTELIQAAVKARQLGLELESVTQIANSLIDIESSISAQMEASVLTGKNLNLNRARQLALEGDILGATEATLGAVGSLSEFNDMHFLQKKAIAKAAGLEVKELTKALRQQEAIADMSAKQKEELEAAQAVLKDSSKIDSENYLRQQKMQGAMTKFKNLWEQIVILAGDVLLPVIEPLINGLASIASTLSSVFKVIMDPAFLIGAGAVAMLVPGGQGIGLALLTAGGLNLLGGSASEKGTELPEFASGTTDFEGGPAIVGERGPELVGQDEVIGEKGPELVGEHGPELVGEKGPELVTLPKESNVLTSSQTSKVFSPKAREITNIGGNSISTEKENIISSPSQTSKVFSSKADKQITEILPSTQRDNNSGKMVALLNEVNDNIKRLSVIIKKQDTDIYLDGKKVTAGLINLEPINGVS